MAKKHTELWKEFSNIKFDDEGKIKNLRKLRKTLKELAASDEEEDIMFIAKVASKYVSLGDKGEKTGYWLYHPLNKGAIYNALYMDFMLEILYNANTKAKNELLFQLGNQHIEFIDYKIKTAPRLFSPEYVFDNFSDEVVEYNLSIELRKGYGIYKETPECDDQKTWDKRWGLFLAKTERGGALKWLYNSDIEAWSALLASCKISEFEGSGLTMRQFRQDCKWYCEVLQKAYKNNHPEKEFYYNEFLKQGVPKDLLDKYVVEYKK